MANGNRYIDQNRYIIGGNIMKLRKRIAAFGAALVMAVSMMSIGASAYTPVVNWDVKLAPGLPTSAGDPLDVCTFYSYGGGYRTKCASISGSNDRYVKVTHSGGSSYNITTTGLSNIVYVYPMTQYVTFNIEAKGSRLCYAYGSVGYNT